MPESEALKVVLQLGSFGLLGYAVLWILRVGGPMIRDTVKDLGVAHVEAMERIAVRLERIEIEHTRQLETMDKNCRAERIQLANLLANTHPGSRSEE